MRRTSKPFSIFLIVLLVFSLSSIFVPLTHATEIFSAGFDDGTFDAWTGTSGTPSVDTANPHHGTYHMTMTSTKDASTAKYAYKDLGAQYTTLHHRCYVYIDSVDVISGYGTFMAASRAEVYHAYAVGIISSSRYLYLLYRSGGSWVSDTSATTLNLDTYYCIEVKAVINNGAGEFRVYLNGVEIEDLTHTGLDSYTNILYIDRVKNGVPLLSFFGYDIDIDCVVVADAYIGPEAAGINYAIDLTLATGETYLMGQLQWQALNTLSWQTPETYTTLEQWNTSNLLSMSTSETYTLSPQTNYHQEFTWQSTESYTTIWQTLFNVITSWTHAETFSTLSQTIYNLAVSFSQSFSWLTEVTQSIAGVAYVIDLAWASASTWLLSLQSNFNSAIAWVTSATYTILTQNIFNLVTSLTQGFSWLTDVYIVPAAVAYAVDLVWATSQTWTITLIQGLQYFVELALTTPLQWLTDIGLSAGLSGTDAVGIAIAFSMITIVICIGLVFGIKKKK